MTLLKPEHLRPFAEKWERPTGEVIAEVLHRAGLTGVRAAQLTGVADDRSVRRWTGDERGIPYAAWALLCHAAGLGQIWLQQQDAPRD
ncbi:transcriptional regulator [Paraburkholderia largidicola]|uniref:Uncharacterized protein n=1 Tax=Paraburkholderia largidicola TaxID=3014751 RepID=A0A7I8C3K9_9BURK|nr:transcriptional regulator [Paraburkholderia sp. PGU16]BCF95393.1 hypothetical protein PPGU16_84600 [Paraburkholderia sp. PGU16]